MSSPGLLVVSSSLCLGSDHSGLDWLIEAVPGVPGEDYPIYAEVRAGQFGMNSCGVLYPGTGTNWSKRPLNWNK